MIITTIIHVCPNCASQNIVKNGKDYKGAQKYKCNDCGIIGTLEAKARYSESFKDMVIRAYCKRQSMCGIYRAFGVHPDTLVRWLIERAEILPEISETLDNAQLNDVLELDECRSCSQKTE